MQIKLAIVDDDDRMSQNLKNDLVEFTEIQSIVISNGGLKFARELESMPAESLPDIVIMDISMGFGDEGIRATRQIKSKFPGIGIIMFTINDEDDRVFEAFKSGAMGYLLKNEPPAFILKTILDVKLGGAQMSPSIAKKAIQFFLDPKSAAKPEQPASEDAELSVREIEILQHVSKGMTYQQIGQLLFISPNTVKKHMVNIFGKLHVKNKIEALKKAERYH